MRTRFSPNALGLGCLIQSLTKLVVRRPSLCPPARRLCPSPCSFFIPLHRARVRHQLPPRLTASLSDGQEMCQKPPHWSRLIRFLSLDLKTHISRRLLRAVSTPAFHTILKLSRQEGISAFTSLSAVYCRVMSQNRVRSSCLGVVALTLFLSWQLGFPPTPAALQTEAVSRASLLSERGVVRASCLAHIPSFPLLVIVLCLYVCRHS